MSKLADILARGKPALPAQPAAKPLTFQPSATPPTQPSAALPLARKPLVIGKPASTPASVSSGANGGIAGLGKPLAQQAPAPQPQSLVAADIANLEINLQNDVTDWPEFAYSDIDTSTVEGKIQAMLNEVQRVLLTDDVSSVMHRTMQFLQDNPGMSDTLLPDQIGLLVTALESSYGVVINTKTENRGKRAKAGAVASDLANAFADLQF